MPPTSMRFRNSWEINFGGRGEGKFTFSSVPESKDTLLHLKNCNLNVLFFCLCACHELRDELELEMFLILGKRKQFFLTEGKHS